MSVLFQMVYDASWDVDDITENKAGPSCLPGTITDPAWTLLLLGQCLAGHYFLPEMVRWKALDVLFRVVQVVQVGQRSVETLDLGPSCLPEPITDPAWS